MTAFDLSARVVVIIQRAVLFRLSENPRFETRGKVTASTMVRRPKTTISSISVKPPECRAGLLNVEGENRAASEKG